MLNWKKYMNIGYKNKILIVFFSLFLIFPAYSKDNDEIKNNFLVLIEKEFLNNKIHTKKNFKQKKFFNFRS